MNLKEEIWALFLESAFSNYYVSNLGLIKSENKKSGKTTLRSLNPNKKGYLRCNVNGKNWRVHRLVAMFFVSGRSGDRDCVNHKNGIKTDNAADNLEWVSVPENNYHSMFVLGVAQNHPVTCFDKKGNKIASFDSKAMAYRFGFTDKYMMLSEAYSKQEALKILNKPRKSAVYKEDRSIGCNDFNKTCDPVIKNRILNDLANKRSIKEIISEYGVSYYKVSVIKGNAYGRNK